MAIKGKGKTRRRTVTPGPKQVYVQPPRPFWRKRWFLVTVASVVAAGIIAGIVAIIVVVHHDNVVSAHKRLIAAHKRLIAREKLLVGNFNGMIETAIEPISSPTSDTFTLFPTLSQGLSAFQAGTLGVTGATQESVGDVSLAKRAATAIGATPASTIASGHPDLLPLIDAQQNIVASLQVFQQAAAALGSAAKTTSADKQAFITQAQSLVQIGGTLFQNGYLKVINVEVAVGIPPHFATPTPPTQPPIPPPPPSPSPSPSAKASPTAKASSSPKASPPGRTKHSPKPKATSSPTK